MYQIGDVIQIIDKEHPWFPCLLIVDEVKSFGVRAYALVPKSNDGSEAPSQALNRLKFDQILKIGNAAIVVE